jgi:hypothetical protein
MGVVSRMVKALTVPKAESEVTRLEQAVVRWQDEAERTREELAELEAGAGAVMLSERPREAAREMAGRALELRFLIDGAQAAAQAAERQLRDARWDLALAQVADKRQRAGKLTAEADALQAKVDEMLRQLTELDGATYVPQPELLGPEREAAVYNGGYELPVPPRADVLRDEAAKLLGEAQRLEDRVTEERRDLAERESPVVPRASIRVPAWDDVDSDSQVSCFVNEGTGSATFEVSTPGQNGGVELVTLPDEQGRRSWGKRVRIPPGTGAEIRCNGQVLAQESRPGRLVGNGLGTWWVELSPEQRAAL